MRSAFIIRLPEPHSSSMAFQALSTSGSSSRPQQGDDMLGGAYMADIELRQLRTIRDSTIGDLSHVVQSTLQHVFVFGASRASFVRSGRRLHRKINGFIFDSPSCRWTVSKSMVFAQLVSSVPFRSSVISGRLMENVLPPAPTTYVK